MLTNIRSLFQRLLLMMPDVALDCLWPNVYRACTDNAISNFLVKILTPHLDSTVHNILHGTDILAIDRNLPAFWPYFDCA